jgi:hypothetical protein
VSEIGAAHCPLCGEPNGCALALPEAERPAACWCVSESFPAALLAKAPATACICAKCLAAHEAPEA